MKPLQILRRIIVIVFYIGLAYSSYSQGPPPPPGGGPTETDPPVGSAPIGNGVVMLLTFASAFGAIKILHARISK